MKNVTEEDESIVVLNVVRGLYYWCMEVSWSQLWNTDIMLTVTHLSSLYIRHDAAQTPAFGTLL